VFLDVLIPVSCNKILLEFEAFVGKAEPNNYEYDKPKRGNKFAPKTAMLMTNKRMSN